MIDTRFFPLRGTLGALVMSPRIQQWYSAPSEGTVDDRDVAIYGNTVVAVAVVGVVVGVGVLTLFFVQGLESVLTRQSTEKECQETEETVS